MRLSSCASCGRSDVEEAKKITKVFVNRTAKMVSKQMLPVTGNANEMN